MAPPQERCLIQGIRQMLPSPGSMTQLSAQAPAEIFKGRMNPQPHIVPCRGETGPLSTLLGGLGDLLLQLSPGGGRGHHVHPHRRRHRRLRLRPLLPEEARSAVQGHAASSQVSWLACQDLKTLE